MLFSKSSIYILSNTHALQFQYHENPAFYGIHMALYYDVLVYCKLLLVSITINEFSSKSIQWWVEIEFVTDLKLDEIYRCAMIWTLDFIIFHYTGRNTLDANKNQPTTEKGQYSVGGKIYKPLLESTRPFIFLPFILRGKRPFDIREHKLAHERGNVASKRKK